MLCTQMNALQQEAQKAVEKAAGPGNTATLIYYSDLHEAQDWGQNLVSCLPLSSRGRS